MIQIEEVKIYQVVLPFALNFSHSLRKRSSVQNIIVEVIAAPGSIKGYGEGAPRSYVTGESPGSVLKSIHRFTQQDNFPWKLNHVSQIWNFVDSLSNQKIFNSAICALETALLDALGKSQNRSIAEYFPQDFYADIVYHGAAIPLADKQKTTAIGQMIKKMKINKLKLKLGKDYAQNKEALQTVRLVFKDDYDLKVDVNGAWNRKLAFKHIPLIEEYKIRVLEQPMASDDSDLADFARSLKSFDVILMADESACTLQDVKQISAENHYGMINVRLSKCGGFRNSLKLIDYLRKEGIQFQIGCHLGESGILSAAGRVLCLLCSDAAYYDCAYDEFLLKENITLEDVSFGPGGRAGPLDGPGLGVKVNYESLARLSNSAGPFTISSP